MSWYLNAGGGYPVALNEGEHASSNVGLFFVDLHGGVCFGAEALDRRCVISLGIGAKFLWDDNSVGDHQAGNGVLGLPLSMSVRIWSRRRVTLVTDFEIGLGLRVVEGASRWDNTIYVGLGFDLRIHLAQLNRHMRLLLIPSVHACYFGEGIESNIGHMWMLPVGISIGLEGLT